MPSVTFLQYFVLFFDENTSKILQDIRKYCFFSKFITRHMCIAQQMKILFFSSKILFSAQKILQTFLQGWHPCMNGFWELERHLNENWSSKVAWFNVRKPITRNQKEKKYEICKLMYAITFYLLIPNFFEKKVKLCWLLAVIKILLPYQEY